MYVRHHGIAHNKLQLISFPVMPVTYLIQNLIFLYSTDHVHGIAPIHLEQLELKQSQTEIHILTRHSVMSLRDASGLVNYFLINNLLIVQSVYIHNYQASIHVVLNCILNFTCAC